MKMIAHRGASLVCPENTTESLERASTLGAYAVECDIRRLGDGSLVIFHDPELLRLAGDSSLLLDITYEHFSKSLVSAGLKPLLLKDLLASYNGSAPILFHINTETDDELVSVLRDTKVSFICGVCEAAAVKRLSSFLPPSRILGFIPAPSSADEFLGNGAGIIRLWENWLDFAKPCDIPSEVWIMANKPDEGGMNGCRSSLDYFNSLGADGVLLNDISLGLEWSANNV